MNRDNAYHLHQHPTESSLATSKHSSSVVEAHHTAPASTEDIRNRANRTAVKQTLGRGDQQTAATPKDRKYAHGCQPSFTPYKKERRPSEAMCTLKTELATLKDEISKLMTLDGKLREDSERRQSFGSYSTSNDKRRERDTASMSHSVLYNPSHNNDLSFLVKEEETPANERVHYVLLENESLKLQLKNLKIRYVQRKAELKDQIHCLQLKVISLEGMLQRAGQAGQAPKDSEKAQLIQSMQAEISRLKSNQSESTNRVALQRQREKELSEREASLQAMKEKLGRVGKVLEGKERSIRQLQAALQSSDARRSDHVRLAEQHFKRELESAIRFKESEIEALQKECQRFAEVLQVREQQLHELTSRQGSQTHLVESLRKELHEKQRQLDQLSHEKQQASESHRQHSDQLERLAESLRQQLSLSEAKLGESHRAIGQQQREIEKFINRRSESHAVENALQAQVERLQAVLIEKEERYHSLLGKGEGEAKELNEVAHKLSGRIGQLEQLLEGSGNTIRAVETENWNLRESIRSLTAQMNTLSSSQHQAERVTEQLNKNSRHYEQKISKLRTEYEQHIQQLGRSGSQASSMIDQLNLRLRQREAELAQLHDQLTREHRAAEEISTKSRKTSSEIGELEAQLHAKEQDLNKQREAVARLHTELDAHRQDNGRLHEQLYKLGSLSDRSQQQNSLLRKQESIIEQLQLKLEKSEEQLSSSSRQMGHHLSSLQRLESQLQEKERQLARKDEQLAALNTAIRQRDSEFRDERERWRRSDRSTQQSKLIETLEGKLREQSNHYDEIIRGLKEELQQRHRDDLSRSRSSMGDMSGLDQAMKVRQDEIRHLRENLSQRNLELQRVQDSLVKTKSELDNLKSQYGVDRVRSISERNMTQTTKDIEIMNLKSDLHLQRKTNESAMQKLKYLNEESRKKDSFIQSHLIGRKMGSQEQLDLKEFFSSYEREFPRETLHTRLFPEVRELHRLSERVALLESQLASNGGLVPPQ